MNIQGVTAMNPSIRAEKQETSYEKLPNLIHIISEETLTKRSTVRDILLKSERISDFLINPQEFTKQVLEIIRHNRGKQAVDGVSYLKLQGQEYYAQEVFTNDQLMANLDSNAVPVDHSVYDYVRYDSKTVERPFAVALDNDPDVKLFFKIPSNFKIDTPIGTYNPDWAVYLNRDDGEKLYLVVETKGTVKKDGNRPLEDLKIDCGKKHFQALENNTDLKKASSWNEFKINL